MAKKKKKSKKIKVQIVEGDDISKLFADNASVIKPVEVVKTEPITINNRVPEPTTAQGWMQQTNLNIPVKKRLQFDARTGELIVADENKLNEDAVVVDQIYKDGFFMNNSTIKPHGISRRI